MACSIHLPLTEQQEKTLHYIIQSIDEDGFPPTITQIQKTLGFKNPGYVHKILIYLQKKGYIIRTKGIHRSIRLTDLCDNIHRSNHLSLIETIT